MGRYKNKYDPNLKYTIDQILEILSNAYDEYIADETEISYVRIIEKHGITRSFLEKWQQSEEPSEELIMLYKDFMYAQQEKLVRNGLMGTYNAGFSKFILESNHGFMREGERQKIDQNNRAIDLSKPIQIGFSDTLIEVDEDYED